MSRRSQETVEQSLEKLLHDPARHEFRRLWKAIMLAKDVETLDALLRGESVPVNRLDAEWVARFGRRS